jgi:DNA-binding response OmpR family regulator
MARILVVDDDAAVRSTVQRILERAGHTVQVAENGADGLRKFREARHDLVVTDLYMPEKEGIETIQDLRAESPGTRILAVSGGLMGDKTGLVDAELLGADATLAKPFTPEQLQKAVAALLAR